MKQNFVITLIAIFCGVDLIAQTNTNQVVQSSKTNEIVKRTAPIAKAQPALSPGHAALTSISQQIAALEKKLELVRAKHAAENKRNQLQQTAGKPFKHWGQLGDAQTREVQEIKKQIAALRLKEMDIRQYYKIPDQKDVKKKP